MEVETRHSVEEGQGIEQIDEIRNGLRAIYDLPEVKDAVLDDFFGRRTGIIVDKPPFLFQFFSRKVSELGPDYSKLKLRRFRLQGDGSISLDERYQIDASSPRITVIQYKGWADMDEALDYNRDSDREYIYGEEAISIARDVISSFNQQRFPSSS